MLMLGWKGPFFLCFCFFDTIICSLAEISFMIAFCFLTKVFFPPSLPPPPAVCLLGIDESQIFFLFFTFINPDVENLISSCHLLVFFGQACTVHKLEKLNFTWMFLPYQSNTKKTQNHKENLENSWVQPNAWNLSQKLRIQFSTMFYQFSDHKIFHRVNNEEQFFFSFS